jgi:AcrR family transcriptional regulator
MSELDNTEVGDYRARGAETQRRNSRNKIIGAAALHFFQDGYTSTSMGDIVVPSVSRATIYNRFASKDQIGTAVLESTFSSTIEAADADPGTRPTDVLAVSRLLQDVLSYYDGIGSALAGERARTGLPNTDLIPDIYARFQAVLTEGQANGDIRTDISADLMSDLYIDTIVTDSLSPSADPEQSMMRLTVLADGMRAGVSGGE